MEKEKEGRKEELMEEEIRDGNGPFQESKRKETTAEGTN